MKNLVTLFLMLATTWLYAQKYYPVDLSADNQHEQTISLDYNGIELVNKIPGATYTVKIEVEVEIHAEGAQEELLAPRVCDAGLLDKIKSSTNEAEVSAGMKALEKLTDDTKDPDKKPCLVQVLAEAKELTTEKNDFTFQLEKNQNIYITIARKADEEVVKTWQVTLRTPRTINYFSHFGFTFVPNGVKNSDKYFSKQTGTNLYTITQMNNNGSAFWKDLSLTANYIIPLVNLNHRVKFGWSGGFGINGEAKFTVFTGPSVLFDDFLSLSFNGGLHNRYKLKGEYTPGQELSENLSIDQLNERGLRPAFIISLGFRLSKEQLQAPIENKGDKN
jgi:hypothetical protein